MSISSVESVLLEAVAVEAEAVFVLVVFFLFGSGSGGGQVLFFKRGSTVTGKGKWFCP